MGGRMGSGREEGEWEGKEVINIRGTLLSTACLSQK